MKRTVFFLALVFQMAPLFAQRKLVNSLSDGSYVEVNGRKLWVVTLGEGNPIVFIPGGPGSGHLAMRSMDSLADHHKLIFFDPLGRGKSDSAQHVSDYNLARDIDDVEGLRRALNMGKITVLGHSYRGIVAQGYAIKYPNQLNHLILVDTFHSHVMWQANDDNFNHEIQTNYPELWEKLMSLRHLGVVSSDDTFQEIYKQVPYTFLYAYNPANFEPSKIPAPMRIPYPAANRMKIYIQMTGKDGDFVVSSDLGQFDYRNQLKSLKTPILIMNGRNDRVATPAMAIKYKEYCPQAQFVFFEKSGHNPFFEEPDKFFKLVNDFLAQ